MKKTYVIVAIVLVALAVFTFRENFSRVFFNPTDSSLPDGVEVNNIESKELVSVVAENLSVPWDVVFLPDGDILVSERSGSVVKINGVGSTTRLSLETPYSRGEGGLLGMALDPEFEKNRYIYTYETYREDGEILNRVVRFKYLENDFAEPFVVIDDIPGASYHDGGRIRFSSGGLLYITTGDSGREELAQDRRSLAGKILRVFPDGRIPEGNPFGNEVYSYGHRNPQGIDWDEEGRLWSTEHGRTGVLSGFDELNLIEAGGNYGWPTIQGDEEDGNMLTPVAHSGPKETWAPASLVYHEGSLFWGGLRGEAIYEAILRDQSENQGEMVEIKRHFVGDFGRVRTIVLGPDGYFYITTSNTDGRGSPKSGDDKLIRIDPAVFLR